MPTFPQTSRGPNVRKLDDHESAMAKYWEREEKLDAMADVIVYVIVGLLAVVAVGWLAWKAIP